MSRENILLEEHPGKKITLRGKKTNKGNIIVTAIIRSRDLSGHGFCISAALQPPEDLVRKGPSWFTHQKALEINKWSERWKKTPVCFIDSAVHWCLENSGELSPDFL